MDKLTAIANSQRERKKPTGYKLVHNGKTVAEHRSPSYLNWFKSQNGLKGALVLGVYV